MGTTRFQHGHRVNAIAFSPDGKVLVSGSAEAVDNVALWEVATGRRLATLRGHGEYGVHAVAISPDGALVATGGNISFSGRPNNTLRLWDFARRSEKVVIEGPTVASLAFSPDGGTLAVGDWSNHIRLLAIPDGRERLRFKVHRMVAYAVTFSADGRRLASGGDDNAVRLWNPADGSPIAQFMGHTATVYGVAFSPDGKMLASAGDRTIRLWDVATRSEVFRADRERIMYAVAFSPDGVTLAFGGEDKTISLLDVASRKIRGTLKGHEAYLRRLAFSRDGRILASAGGQRRIRLWDVAEGREIHPHDGHTDRITGLAVSRNGRILASAGDSGVIRAWDTAEAKVRSKFVGHRYGIKVLALSPDGGTVAYSTQTNDVFLADLGTGKITGRLRDHTGWPRSFAFSPNGELLVSADQGKNVIIWQLRSRKRRQELRGHAGRINAVAFSPDGAIIASGSERADIRLWDAATGRELRCFERPRHVSVTWDSDTGTARHFDAQGNEVPDKGHRHGVVCLAFSPDGRMLASADRGRHSWREPILPALESPSLRLWDVATGRELWVAMGQLRQPFTALGWSPDGRHVATANAGGSVVVREAATGEELHSFVGHDGIVTGLVFSVDGSTLYSAGTDSQIFGWDLKAIGGRRW